MVWLFPNNLKAYGTECYFPLIAHESDHAAVRMRRKAGLKIQTLCLKFHNTGGPVKKIISTFTKVFTFPLSKNIWLLTNSHLSINKVSNEVANCAPLPVRNCTVLLFANIGVINLDCNYLHPSLRQLLRQDCIQRRSLREKHQFNCGAISTRKELGLFLNVLHEEKHCGQRTYLKEKEFKDHEGQNDPKSCLSRSQF